MSTPDADSNNCFVCGSGNPIGLGIRFRLEDGLCRAEFTPGDHHIGWDRVVHGGILFAAMDDVMANWLYLQGIHGFTARCDLRFRRPVTVGTTLSLTGRPVHKRGQMVTMQARAEDVAGNTLFAECEARFMISQEHLEKVEAVLAKATAGGKDGR